MSFPPIVNHTRSGPELPKASLAASEMAEGSAAHSQLFVPPTAALERDRVFELALKTSWMIEAVGPMSDVGWVSIEEREDRWVFENNAKEERGKEKEKGEVFGNPRRDLTSLAVSKDKHLRGVDQRHRQKQHR